MFTVASAATACAVVVASVAIHYNFCQFSHKHKGEDRMALQHIHSKRQTATTHKFTIKFNSFVGFPQKVTGQLQQ